MKPIDKDRTPKQIKAVDSKDVLIPWSKHVWGGMFSEVTTRLRNRVLGLIDKIDIFLEDKSDKLIGKWTEKSV